MKKYAYVVLLMINDSYLDGALVCGYSIRKNCILSPTIELVCMITEGVSQKAKDALVIIFDKVVVVPLLSVDASSWGSKKQKELYHWIEYSPTKWNCLALTDYDKVFLLDADMIVLEDLSHVFSFSTPAGVFTSPYMYPYRKPGMWNPYLNIKKGQKIPNKVIQRVLTTPKVSERTFAVFGTSVLLKPSVTDYKKFIDLLNMLMDFGHSASGTDEQLICLFYLKYHPDKLWTQLGAEYTIIPRFKEWSDQGKTTYIIHYYNDKPWNNPREKWPDFEIWWDLYDEMLEVEG